MKIIETDNKIAVESEYHKDLPSKAKQIGGKWNVGLEAWIFDIRTKKAVEKLYKNIYGVFGESNDLVTIRFFVPEDIAVYRDAIYVCGKQIARAFGRDSEAKTHSDAIFNNCHASSGGSVKNWQTKIIADEKNAYIDIYDVPRLAAEQSDDNIKILNENKINREELLLERKDLEKRIKTIDEILG